MCFGLTRIRAPCEQACADQSTVAAVYRAKAQRAWVSFNPSAQSTQDAPIVVANMSAVALVNSVLESRHTSDVEVPLRGLLGFLAFYTDIAHDMCT